MTGWSDIQDSSFYEASARQRAFGLLDDGSFRELAGPEKRITSPHLAALGEAVSFDDGVVTGVGTMGGRTAFVISQEGRFIGGSVGEAGGAKIVGIFQLALSLYEKVKDRHPDDVETRAPLIVFSFESGGVRLQEANAGLLAHAEVMEQVQRCRGKVPTIFVVGSRLGCFGGMGFIAVSGDVLIMSEQGRVGLTGPEVIEQEMGKNEFDASDRALIYRTTGGKHRTIMRDCAFLVSDTIRSFRTQILELAKLTCAQLQPYRCIGTLEHVLNQMSLVDLAVWLNPGDSMDVWKYFGNQNADRISDMELDEFMHTVKLCPRKEER